MYRGLDTQVIKDVTTYAARNDGFQAHSLIPMNTLLYILKTPLNAYV